MARTLGLDVGDRRIGVALSDAQGILVSPVSIIERTAEGIAVKAILDIVGKNAVGKIIVGLPVSMNGTIGSQAEKVKTFAEELRQQTKVPVEYRDERLSTVSARRLKQSGPKNNRKLHHDAMAAAVILQSYLDEAPSTAAIPFPAFDVTTCEKYNCNQETFGGRMMKFTRVFRIMSLVVIVSMLLIALPATPALAAAAVTLSPAQGNIGDKITVRGSGFTPSTDVSEKWVDLYFTNKSGLIRGSYIDTDVTVYEK